MKKLLLFFLIIILVPFTSSETNISNYIQGVSENIPTDNTDSNLFMGFPMGIIIILIIINFFFYLFNAMALFTVAAESSEDLRPIYAFIPILNVYLMLRILKIPVALLLMFILVSFIPYARTLFILGFNTVFWTRIAMQRGKPIYYGLLTIVPLLNVYIIWKIVWNSKYTYY